MANGEGKSPPGCPRRRRESRFRASVEVRSGRELIQPLLPADEDLVVSRRGVRWHRLRGLTPLAESVLDAGAEVFELSLGRRRSPGIHEDLLVCQLRRRTGSRLRREPAGCSGGLLLRELGALDTARENGRNS